MDDLQMFPRSVLTVASAFQLLNMRAMRYHLRFFCASNSFDKFIHFYPKFCLKFECLQLNEFAAQTIGQPESSISPQALDPQTVNRCCATSKMSNLSIASIPQCLQYVSSFSAQSARWERRRSVAAGRRGVSTLRVLFRALLGVDSVLPSGISYKHSSRSPPQSSRYHCLDIVICNL